MDIVIFAWCNRLVSYSWWTFFKALDWTAQIQWTVATATFVALWFAGAQPITADTLRRPRQPEIRGHVLLMFAAMAFSFVAARGLQGLVHKTRPFASGAQMIVPIEPEQWKTIIAGISTQGSFPSDHAVMFAVMIVGVWWAAGRVAGSIATAVCLSFSVARVGTGFHWPSDIAAGAAVGTVVTLCAFLLWNTVTWVRERLLWFVRQFDERPVVAYTLWFLVLYDFSHHFSFLMYTASMLLGREIGH